MIKAQRVLEAVEFLKPEEAWTTMAERGIRLTVYGMMDGLFKVEMNSLDIGETQMISMELISRYKGGPKDALAFILVQMASRLGAYNEELGARNEDS